MKTPFNALIKPITITVFLSVMLNGCNFTDKEEQTTTKPSQQQTNTQQQAKAHKQKQQRHYERHQAIKASAVTEKAKMDVNYAAAQGFRPPGQPSPIPRPITEDQEHYQQTPVNPVFTTSQDPVSTFSIDVDTASYSNIRRLLNHGNWPDKGAVRVEEMLNYFDYQYPAPTTNEQPFLVHTQVAPSPWSADTHLVQVALKGYQSDKSKLPAMNLVFLLDVSGSMHHRNKLPLLKRAFSLLTKQLRPQDHVSIVTYAGASGLVLKPTPGDQHQTILNALDKLSAGGSTNGGEGIQLAYTTAAQHFDPTGINRVILATDGDFNVGLTSIDKLKALIEEKKQTGVFLSILGFGQGNYNDHLSEELSNIGNGTSYYIDSFKEARKVFADGLTGTLQTIAKDVKIQVEFNPAYISEYRLIGYDNRVLNREDFNNDKVDAGDIGAGHTVTAFYEVTLTQGKYRFNDPLRYSKTTTGDKNGEIAYVKLRYKQPNQDQSQLITQPIVASQIKSSFEQSTGDFKFAVAVVGFGEQLRRSKYVQWPLAEIKQLAQSELGQDPWGYRHELVQLVLNAQALEQ